MVKARAADKPTHILASTTGASVKAISVSAVVAGVTAGIDLARQAAAKAPSAPPPASTIGALRTKPADFSRENKIAFLGDSVLAYAEAQREAKKAFGPSQYVRTFAIASDAPGVMLGRIKTKATARTGKQELPADDYGTVVVLGGVNGIASPDKAFDDLQRIAKKAKATGMRVVVMTLLPWEGYPSCKPKMQANTDALNARIRNELTDVDVIIDANSALADPKAPSRSLAGLSFDHLHLNAAGMAALMPLINDALQNPNAEPTAAAPNGRERRVRDRGDAGGKLVTWVDPEQ